MINRFSKNHGKQIGKYSPIIFIIVIMVVLILSSCAAKKENHTLLNKISESDDLNNIVDISILSGMDSLNGVIITEESAFEFMKKYTYSHTDTDAGVHWDKKLADTVDISLAVNTKTCGIQYIYLMKDGTIAVEPQMSDNYYKSYDFYRANEDDISTKEKLELFLDEVN